MLGSGLARGASQNPPTIKDLDNQPVTISTDPPQGVDAAQTMDSYRRFLDLNGGDAGLRASEAITLYSALLKAYPNYERNDAVLYQLARAYELAGQPEKALASLD